MLVKDIGGEFELIQKLLPASGKGAAILLPNGDDAAVVRPQKGALAATVDSIVEGTHFSFDYFTPKQAGIRAIEGAASDIAAVGGIPRFALCALVLPKRTTTARITGIYSGVSSALGRIGAALIGGDTSSGAGPLSIAVTILGEIPRGGNILTRGGARPGDLLMVSGGLGGSAAGLALLQRRTAGFAAIKRYHLEPACRFDIGVGIAKHATSAIDISDGLSSEIHHLCRASGCGAVIELDKLPFKPGVDRCAQALGIPLSRLLLNGGEEYEILFTVPKSKRSKVPGVVIGEITKRRNVELRSGGKLSALASKGFVHLR